MAIDSKDLLVWVKAMSRGQALPLDASEVYASMEEAEVYASSPIAYAGQTIKVKMDDGKYHEYILQPGTSGYVLEEVIGSGGSGGVEGGSSIEIDSYLSSTSTNPVQNKIIYSALEAKADSDHNHDGRYYTEDEVDAEFERLVGETPVSEQIAAALDGYNFSGSTENSKFAEVSLRKWRSVVDSRLSPWHWEGNNVNVERVDFQEIKIVSDTSEGVGVPVSETTEILFGSVTFFDHEYGYLVYDIPDIDNLRVELRNGDKTFVVSNGYTINKHTNNLWESDFKDQTYDIYLILEEGFCTGWHDAITARGIIYECMSIHDIDVSEYADMSEFLNYVAPNSVNQVDVTAVSQEINGVTFTANDDGTVTVNGTATDDITYVYGEVSLIYRRSINSSNDYSNIDINNYSFTMDGDSDIFVGLQRTEDDETISGYYIVNDSKMITNNYHPIPEPSDEPFDGEWFNIVLLIKANTTINNSKFSCKVRMTATKLNKAITQNITDIANIKNVIENKFDNALTYSNINVFEITAESQTIDGVTFTVNDDNSVTINGAVESGNHSIFTLGQHNLSNSMFGCVIQNVSDDVDSNVQMYLCDTNDDFTGVYKFTLDGTYADQDAVDRYGYVNICVNIGTTLTDFTLKPVIYMCESVHEVVQQLKTTGVGGEGGSGIVVDSYLNSTSINPVQNKVIYSALEAKANSEHNHDGRYYTEDEIDTKLEQISNIIENMENVGGSVEIDTTLSKSGAAADAKATGDKFVVIESQISEALGGMRSTSYPIVEPTSATIEPDQYYVFGTVDSLVVLLQDVDDGFTHEYCFEFTAADEFYGMSITPAPKWVDEPSIESNKTYQVSILRGIGVIIGA